MKCIYCLKDKSEDKFSLEHIVPQFLGGSYAPANFKTRAVCRRCNSNLGLFVDGIFARDFLIGWHLREIDSLNIDESKDCDYTLPLICMGKVENISFEETPEDYICESWLGPFGEQVYWIRPHDLSKESYIGGNPIDINKKQSTIYYFLNEKSTKHLNLVLNSFLDFESKNKNIRKILCADVHDNVGKLIKVKGFDDRNELDKTRIDNFYDRKDENIRGSICLSYLQSRRFLAKLAIGLISVLYENPYETLSRDYSKVLYDFMWLHPNNTEGINVLGGEDPEVGLNKFTSIKNCVSLLLMPTNEGLSYVLNLGGKKCYVIKVTDDINGLEITNSKILILNKNLMKSVYIDFEDFVSWRLGKIANKNLDELIRIAKGSEKLLKELRKELPTK